MKRISLLIVLCTIVWFGCAKERTTTAPATPSANAEFTTFVDDYFDWTFRTSPTSATYAGVHDFDGALDDFSKSAIEARITDLHGFQDRLGAIDRAALSFDEQIDAEAIDGAIRSSLLDYETLRLWETNPMLYVWIPGGAIGGILDRDFAPASERLGLLTKRLEKIPATFEAGRANLKNPPREFTDLAIRMASGTVWYLDNTVASWAKDAAGDDADGLAAFETANKAAIEAASSFAEWLKTDLLPRSNGEYAIGAENFSKKLLYDEMVDTPLSEVLAVGEAQLEKDYQAFLETAKIIDPSKSAAEVMKSLSDEHPAADDLIPSVRRTVEEARQYLVDHDLVTIPSEVRPTVKETPPYARAGSFASMDTPGPYETKATEAYYYVTPVEPDWDAKHKEEHLRLYNPYVVAMINVHEAYPGHYLQFLNAPRFKTKTRKLIGAGTNSEGWAHYSEQMMVDEGFGGGDPKIRLAQLQEALLRDCRYVAGIKLHTEGWTVERAAKELFEQKGFQEPANAFEEARRGSYDPTYLCYTLGKIEIQKLRDEYMQKKGASLKEFHDAFVSEGALPIPLVRRIMLAD